jgi:hypothetical protein
VRSSTSHYDRRRVARWTILPALIAIVVAVALPASASAVPCPVNPGNATSWIGGSGSLGDSGNWSNGTPTSSCDVSITAAGDYTVTMTGGANMRSLTLGGAGSTPHLVISDQSPNTNLDAQPAGITIAAGATVTLTCQPGGCPGGGPHIYSGPSPFANAGIITVDSNTGGGSVVGGVIANTGTIEFEKSGSLSGQVTNKGVISVGDGATVANQGSSCGGTEPFVKNDTGGTIGGVGTGVLSVYNFEQGDGATEDVVIPCGSVRYTGTGASQVAAFGGFNLSGEMQENQDLTISAASPNTKATLTGSFTNRGSITLTCPAFGCEGGATGGAGFNVAGNAFTNAGTFTVSSGSGSGADIDGNGGAITNTGTMQFNQHAALRGVILNKGPINLNSGVIVSSTTNCGDTGPRLKNDTNGQINASGAATLLVTNYEQGAGTTSGALPVQINCGSLKYSGNGASTVQANGGFSLSGEMQAGQALTINAAGNNTNAVLQTDFTNKGSITLTCPVLGCSGSGGGGGGGAGFNANGHAFTNAGSFTFAAGSGTDAGISGGVTNTGTIRLNQTSSLGGQVEQTGAGAELFVTAGIKLNVGEPVKLKAGTLRGGGTVNGTVENTGGVVAPGASPGTLTLTGNYLQSAGGRLEIEIAGTGAGQFDALAVGGVATLDGTLALVPSSGFAGSSAVGDSVPFLTYGSSVAGGFATTTVNPELSCGKAFATSTDAGAKAVKATVVAGGTPCPSGGSGSSGGGAAQPPISPPPPTPPKTCPKGKQVKKGKCVAKKCPKGKKLKRGRCVKKKQPKAKASRRRF